MPSRSFYYQTADGCLERNVQDGYRNLPILTSAEYPAAEFDYKFSIADVDKPLDSRGQPEATLSSSIEDELSVDGYDADGRLWEENLSNQLIGGTPNQIFLDDVVINLDENCPTQPMVQDFDASSSDMEWREDCQDVVSRCYQDYPSLTGSEERRLRDIAMPPRVAITEVIEAVVVSSSPPGPKKRVRTKKRKPVMENEAAEAVKRKRGHNAIEKRYRTNLNEKIMTLRQSIPSLRVPLVGEQPDANVEECEESNPDASQSFGKAAILTKAVEYIVHLEHHIQQLSSDIIAEKARVMAFEQLAMSGSRATSKVTGLRKPITDTLETIQAGKLQGSLRVLPNKY